ncbi:MAG TPA: ABC transporter permease [Bacillota bacterium]|nr:ABC transporter permease [Bacillota bacterium]
MSDDVTAGRDSNTRPTGPSPIGSGPAEPDTGLPRSADPVEPATTDGPPTGGSDRARSEFARAWARYRHNKVAFASLVFVGLLVLTAIFGPFFTPYGVSEQDITNRLQPMGSPGHLLGTDALGRDLLSRLVHSLRSALTIGFVAEGLSLGFALLIGMTAGFLGGRAEQLLMLFTDVMFAFPRYLFAIILVVAMGQGLWTIIIAISVASWVGQARLARAQALKIKNFAYVEAGRSMGARGFTLVLRYILPNSWGPLLVTTSFGIPAAIAAEAGLAILGLGVQPPTPTWGGMIMDGYHYVLGVPHLIVWPLLLFSLTMLAFTFIGDGFRDAFDVAEEEQR